MGYYADGSVTIEFPGPEAVAAALHEIATNPDYQGMWPYGTNTAPDDLWTVFSGVWGTNGSPTIDSESRAVTFNGWVDDKWLDVHGEMVQVLARHASSLTGSFRGEDGYGWAWSLRDGHLHEDNLHDVSDSELSKLRSAEGFTSVVLSALAAAGDNDGVARVVKIAALSLPEMTPELIIALAHDQDPEVAAAAARHVQQHLAH